MSDTRISHTGPFKGLDYFTETDRDIFAGRDRDIQEIVARVSRDRIFVLYGRSGLRKTSLLQAGVFPELRKRGYVPVYIRTLDSPVKDFEAALVKALKDALDIETDGIHDGLRQAATQKTTMVLVFDQFEEFFIRFRNKKQERLEYIRTIAYLTGDLSLDLRIVFSLREDYLAELDEFRRDMPTLFDNEYRLVSLTAFGARQAIIQPLVKAGINYDQRLVTQLVDQLAQDDFQPPLLQIACVEAYRQAKERVGNRDSVSLEVDDLETAGDFHRIFQRYLDKALVNISPRNHLLTRVILDALITRDRTKRAVDEEFFRGADFDFIAEEKDCQGVLESLVNYGLLRKDKRGNKDWYELVHDKLVDTVLPWMDRDNEFLKYRTARNMIFIMSAGEDWQKSPDTLLPKGAVDDLIGPYKTHLRLTDRQKEFLLRSALRYQAEDTFYWAEHYGAEASVSLVEELLKSRADSVRLGAAKKLYAIINASDRLTSTCLNLALHDNNPEIRRAAGHSFAVLADDADLDKLKSELSNKLTRMRALEVLADIHELEKGYV